GFGAVCLFGRGAWANLTAVGLTVAAIALDALDGHIARRKKMATPMGAQLDILGDRMIENVYFTYFAVVGMVSLWLPVLFFARGAATDFLRGLAMTAGHSGWGGNAVLRRWWAPAVAGEKIFPGSEIPERNFYKKLFSVVEGRDAAFDARNQRNFAGEQNISPRCTYS